MSEVPQQEIDRFSKQMQDKFMKDLQNIQIGDSDSQLQASSDFYQGLKKKITSQITNMRQSTTKNTILQELKATLTKQMTTADQFEEEIKEMKFLNTAAQSAIAQQKILQIKQKLAKQNANFSKITLSDEKVEMTNKKQNKVIFEEVQIQQEENKQVKEKKILTNRTKSFKKKQTTLSINANIERKLNAVNLERERINMQRQDERSMRYEQYCISQFFKERFLEFHIPQTSSRNLPIDIRITKPKNTFTNLCPLSNNEKNVMPRNAPQIALKALKKNKKVGLAPTSQTLVKIEFKKVIYTQQDEVGKKIIKRESIEQKTSEKRMEIKQRFSGILTPYLQSVKGPLRQLELTSAVYKPKFIKAYLNENQKVSNIGVSDLSQKQRSVEQIMSFQEDLQIFGKEKSPSTFREFKMTFENLTSLKGIEKYKQVEFVALQYNIIKVVDDLYKCNKIIELNLSNNQIRNIKKIETLPQLRYLNLSNNKINGEFAFYGGQLQILNLKSNMVEVVTDLNKNRYLRIVNLAQNKLHEIGKGFSKLRFLQELILTKNYLQHVQGAECLLMLQKLDLSYNRLTQLPQIIFLFLNQLDISYNSIQHISNIFLPSLQKLYFTNNKLTGQKIGSKTIYLPQLKQLNLDDNQIKGFSTIWFFIAHSKKLQILKYDSNEYFLSVRQKVRQLYEAIIYRNMSNLKIINHSPYDTGIKAYYESVYGSYLEKGQKLSVVDSNLRRVQQFIANLVEQNKVIAALENPNDKKYNQRFTQTDVFIKAKSINRALMLQQVVKMLAQSFTKSQLKDQQRKGSSFIYLKEQIYFHHDEFQQNLLQKVHKIKSLFYRFKYQKQKRKKYFYKKKDQITSILIDIQHFITVNKLKNIIKLFSYSITKNRQQSAIIKIQKHWRGYKARKLFKKMMKKLKQKVEDDDFDLQQVDLDQFQAHQFPQFNFDLPEDINFENYIIEPKYFQLAAEQSKRRNSKHVQGKQLSSIQQKTQQQAYNPMMNNFIKQEQIKEQKSKKKQQDEKLMKQWGFQNPATLQALRWKKKRKEEMKKKQAEQNMTAAQRFQRFKMMHK